jgi:transposase
MGYDPDQRKKVVQLRKKGLGFQAIADEVGISSAKAAGEGFARYSKRRTYTDAPRRKGHRKLDINQEAILKRVILNNPTCSLREKQVLFNNRPKILAAGITLSHTTISRCTHEWFDVTAPPTAAQQQSEDFTDARIKFCRKQLRTRSIISLDSCEIDTRDLVSDLNAKRQAVRKGCVPAPFPTPPHNASPAVHLYGSVANGDEPLSKVIMVPFKRKQQYVSSGQCKPAERQQKEAFASKHLGPVLKEVCRHAKANNMKRGTWQLLLDGASQHTSAEAKDMLASAGISTVKDFPAHSPDLNPIERVWHLLRAQLRKLIAKHGVPANSKQLEKLVIDAWSRVSKTTARKFMQALPKRMKWVREHGGRFPAP